jgi:hypothetical protein
MITNQSTNQAANTCLLYRWTGCQTEMFYLHRAGQFLIQDNSRSSGKEASVLNGGRSFINVFTRTYHWVMSTHYFYNINFNIILPFTSQMFRECYKRHPSQLTELHAIKMYNFVYARNETQKILKLILVLL